MKRNLTKAETDKLIKSINACDEEKVIEIVNVMKNINEKIIFASSILSLCVSKGLYNVVKRLIELGSNVNLVYDNGYPPLFYSIDMNRLEISKLLIESGADVNYTINSKDSPLITLAIKRGKVDVVDLLISNGINLTQFGGPALFDALDESEKEIAIRLIEASVDVNYRAINGSTPLHLASCSGDVSLVELLLDHGADESARDDDNNSPVMIAGSVAVKEFICNYGTKYILK